jgi:hypothetical protein
MTKAADQLRPSGFRATSTAIGRYAELVVRYVNHSASFAAMERLLPSVLFEFRLLSSIRICRRCGLRIVQHAYCNYGMVTGISPNSDRLYSWPLLDCIPDQSPFHKCKRPPIMAALRFFWAQLLPPRKILLFCLLCKCYFVSSNTCGTSIQSDHPQSLGG